MGKSTINGHFQQLCSKLPEGNSNFGWSSLPWPSYHWPPNWSEAPSLLCMFQCLFRSGKLSHRKAWISQPFFHGFPLTFSWNQFSECCLKPTKHRWRLRCHQLQLGNQCLELPEFVVLALWPHSPVPCYNMGVKIGAPMLPSFLAGNLTKKPGMSVLYPLVN